MLALLFGLVDPISRIAGKIADARIAMANAETDRDKIAADERIKTLEAKRDLLLSESGSRVNSWVRVSFAAPFIAYNAKLVIWDKMLELGSTDPLSNELFQVEIACIGFYFLYDIASRLRGRSA